MLINMCNSEGVFDLNPPQTFKTNYVIWPNGYVSM